MVRCPDLHLNISLSTSHKKTIRKADLPILRKADYTVGRQTGNSRVNRTRRQKRRKDGKTRFIRNSRPVGMYLDNSIVDENAANVRFSRMCPIKHPKSAKSEIPGISRDFPKNPTSQTYPTWERAQNGHLEHYP